MSTILGPDGRPLIAKRLSGKMAIRIMVEEIGDAIGIPRLNEFEMKVRGELAKDFPTIGMARAQDWIQAMATVIVRDDDTKADVGFRKGIRRIRKLGGDV